jgi:hypothetical protein
MAGRRTSDRVEISQSCRRADLPSPGKRGCPGLLSVTFITVQMATVGTSGGFEETALDTSTKDVNWRLAKRAGPEAAFETTIGSFGKQEAEICAMMAAGDSQ